MATINEVEKKLDALLAELATIQSAIDALLAQHGEIDSRLDALLADAERSATPAAKKAATAAETSLADIDSQLRRKRAALASCERDIADAETTIAAAKRAAAIEELLAIADDVEKASRSIDANLGDIPAWEKLTELARRGNLLYSQHSGHSANRNGPFVDPVKVSGFLVRALESRIQAACGERRQSAVYTKMSVSLEIERCKGMIREIGQ